MAQSNMFLDIPTGELLEVVQPLATTGRFGLHVFEGSYKGSLLNRSSIKNRNPLLGKIAVLLLRCKHLRDVVLLPL